MSKYLSPYCTLLIQTISNLEYSNALLSSLLFCSQLHNPQSILHRDITELLQKHKHLTSLHALISHASKVMLKFLQARLQQYVHHELPDVQAGFRKVRGTRDQMANICWIIKKAREF